MWIIHVIVTFILTITSLPETAGKSCSEQYMKDCELKSMQFLHSVNETENGYNIFCDNLKNNTECPMDVDEDCKKQYPTASTFYVEFQRELFDWCNRSSSDRGAYFRIAFCARKNLRGFQKCYKIRYKWFDNGTLDCRQWKYVTCWAEQVAKYCGEEAEKYSKYIYDAIPENYIEYCYGCSSMLRNHWILNLLAFLSLVLGHKIDHLFIKEMQGSTKRDG